MGNRQSVELFFCSACPWSYLAFVRLNEAALRTGANVRYRPVMAEPLYWDGASLHAEVGHADAIVTARIHYATKNLADWARFAGVSIKRTSSLPGEMEFAQRAIVAAIDAGRGRTFVEALFAAYFGVGHDISERSVVLRIAADCGLTGVDFEQRADSATAAAAIETNTHELLARGGFAAPTMFVGSDMYVGNDRVPLVESALMRAADRPFIAPGEHDRL